METKKSKYDTNPLDADVARRSEDVWGQADSGPATQEVKGPTSQVRTGAKESARSNVYSEAPTRRYDVATDNTYPSVFVPPTYSPPVVQQPPAVYQSPGPVSQAPTCRSVAGLGLPENWAMILPYAPSYIGVVASIIELFLVPRKEVSVRFHAAQGLSLQIAILAIQTLFRLVGAITDSSIGGWLFWLASIIFLIISMVRVWKGEPHRIPPLAEPAQWLNERIEPRK